MYFFFFFNDSATTEIYTLSLHDALPISEAINNLQEINIDKVEAYLARRVLDFVVGFNLSPLLWRRLPGAKSAGRVQSVALKLICERESDREVFDPQEYWSIKADFQKEQEKISAQVNSVDGNKLKKLDMSSEPFAQEIALRSKNSLFSISEIIKNLLKEILDLPRSEERRVGKECRSRWSPDH